MAYLKWGSTGKPVKKLQTQLNKTKIAGKKLKADGVFGPLTFEAVKAFQKKEKVSKLKVDGVVGPKTQAALDRFLDSKSTGAADPKELKKKVATAQKALAAYEKYLGQMRRFLDLIQKQKKAGQSAQKAVDKLKKEVRQLEYMSDLAAGECSDAYSCAAGGTLSQMYQDKAHNLKIDANDLQSVHDENQKDFDRRIKDAKKRIEATMKKIAAIKKDLAKMK